MHPGMFAWWKARQRCGTAAHAHAEGGAGVDEEMGASSGDWSGAFGVRRPLRFMAHKLDLTEPQVSELARILDDLKTERAQAAVDGRRTLSALADAIEGETFDEARTRAAAQARVQSAERLRDAVVKALAKVHALLQPPQRAQLAYLIRTGTLLI